MSMNSLLADTLARIKNAQRAKQDFTIVKSSKLVKSVLSLLKNEGYIESFEEFEERKGVNVVKVDLKYFNGKPVIETIKMISKPGCKLYTTLKDLKVSKGGLGTFIISTSSGLKTDHQCRVEGIAGKVLCEVN